MGSIIKWVFFWTSILLTLIYWVVIIGKKSCKKRKFFSPLIIVFYNFLYLIDRRLYVTEFWVNLFFWYVCCGLIYKELTNGGKSSK